VTGRSCRLFERGFLGSTEY